jgi:stage V sporulation protein B
VAAAERTEVEPAPPPKTRQGAIAIAGAKLWFLVAGLLQNALIPLVIGQGGFGAYKRALAFANLVNNVIVVASIQAVSRAIAGAPPEARRWTLGVATRLHALVSLALGVAFFAAIPLIVAHQHAPHHAAILRVLAFVLVAYGIYAPLVGGLNGIGAFGAQAGLDAGYAALRTGLCIAVGATFVHVGFDGALGVAVGFLGAAILIVPCALFMLRGLRDRPGGYLAFDRRAYLVFLVGPLATQGFQALLLQVDLMILGRAVSLHAIGAGASEGAAGAIADKVAGLYAQAQAFGLVPYQLLVAAGYVLFPAIAAAQAKGDREAIRSGVARGGAATLVIAGALVAAIGGTPGALLRFVYGAGAPGAIPIASGAPILRTLALAHGATAIAALGTTLITAAGRGRLAALLAGSVAACALGAASFFARGADPLSIAYGTATGFAIGIAAGAAIVAVAVGRILGPYLRPLSLARVGLALAAALVVGVRIPTFGPRILAPIAALVPLTIYLVVVRVLGEPIEELVRSARKKSPEAT